MLKCVWMPETKHGAQMPVQHCAVDRLHGQSILYKGSEMSTLSVCTVLVLQPGTALFFLSLMLGRDLADWSKCWDESGCQNRAEAQCLVTKVSQRLVSKPADMVLGSVPWSVTHNYRVSTSLFEWFIIVAVTVQDSDRLPVPCSQGG